jgi:hypothetical protein
MDLGNNSKNLTEQIDNSRYKLILNLGKEMQINHHSY